MQIVSLIFSQKMGFDISGKLSPQETIWPEMSKPIFWENKKDIIRICPQSGKG